MYPIIRSIDVGYGNTKYILNRRPMSDDMECGIFPSLAPRAVSQNVAASEGFMRRRDTTRVLVEGLEYEVGPDSPKAQTGSESGRVLKEDYCMTETYRALVYGALLRMEIDHIDVLVLGLPMSTWKSYKSRLAELMTGHHQLDENKGIHIDKCLVAPQPLGGFYDHGLAQGIFRAMQQETNLVIDPGYFTLDWLLADGVVPVDSRSNAVNNGGVAELLREVAEVVATDFDTSISQIGSLERIDESLRMNKPVRIFGMESSRSTEDYLEIARKRAADSLNRMMQNIGATGDIDNVILVGGGSHIYRQLIAEQFPKHRIQIADDAVFSNVRGFQMIGETWARKNLQQAA